MVECDEVIVCSSLIFNYRQVFLRIDPKCAVILDTGPVLITLNYLYHFVFRLLCRRLAEY